MKKQLQQIYDKVQCVAATNVAQHLAPYVQPVVTSTNINMTPTMPSLNVVVTSTTSSFSMMPATPSSISAVQPAITPAPSFNAAITLATDPNIVTCVPSSSVIASSSTTPYRMIPPVTSANPMVPINAVAVPPVGAVTESTTSS